MRGSANCAADDEFGLERTRSFMAAGCGTARWTDWIDNPNWAVAFQFARAAVDQEADFDAWKRRSELTRATSCQPI